MALHELRALFTGEDGKVIVTETPGTTTGQLLAEHKANVDPRAMKALLGNGNRNTLLRQLPPEEHASFEGIWNQLTSLTGHKSAPSPDSFVQLKQKLRSLITDEEGFELTAREISKGCQLSNAVYLLISDAPQPIPPSLISQETEGKIADFLKNTLGKPDAEVAGFRSTFAKLRAMNAERRSSPHHVRRHADDESPRSR